MMAFKVYCASSCSRACTVLAAGLGDRRSHSCRGCMCWTGGVALARRYTNDMVSVSTPMFDTGGLYWRFVYGVLVATISVPQFILVCVGVLSKTPTAALTIMQVRGTHTTSCFPFIWTPWQ